MTVAQYLRLFRAHWLVILLAVLLGAGAGLAYSLFSQKVYSSTVQLFVSTTGSGQDTSDLNQGSTFTQQRVKSYIDFVDSPEVTDAVIKKLGLSFTTDELAANIDATSPLNTVLLNITVRDTEPERAQKIAEEVAAQFSVLVAQIETPDGSASSPVKISVTRHAGLQDTPILPRTKLNTVFGLIAGLALGLGIALLRHAVDRTVRDKEEIARIIDAPVVGSVSEDADATDRALIAGQNGKLRGEEFRHLRTNIRFLSVDRKISSFVVSSALPGEGKTSTASNLAITMAQAGQAVVVVDADLRRPSVADTFGISGAVGLSDVLLGETTVRDAVQRWRPDLPLYVLPSGATPPNPSELLGSHQLEKLIQSLRESGMIVIFDSPPLLPVTDAAVLARATDGVIMVTRIGKTRSDQLTAAIDTLRTASAPILGAVANRVRRRKKAAAYSTYYYAPAAETAS
jgi:capsular exopolysaccharide synthesis family protein